MTTSRASLSCASAAIRRACSSRLQARPSVPAGNAAVEALAPEDLAQPQAARRRRRPRRPRAGRAGRARRPASARARRSARARGARAARARRRGARAGSPAASRRRAGASRSTSSGSFHARKSRELVGADQEERDRPTRDAREACRPCARARRARPRRPGNAALRELAAATSARRLDVLVARGRRRRARSAGRDRASPSPARDSSTWPRCGGSNEPPNRPTVMRARTPRRRSRPSRRAARRRRAARARARRSGRRADHAEAALGAQQLPRRAPSAPADRRGNRRGRRRRARPARARERARTARGGAPAIPSPVAHESAKTAITRGSSIVNVGLGLEVDLVQDDDLRPRVEAGAVRAELRVDRPPLLVGGTRRRRSRGRACARARDARGTRGPSPTPSLAPSISPGTSATTSCRPSGDSTVPSTGCTVVNG